MDVVFIDNKFITKETWREVKSRSWSAILSILNKVCTYTVMCAFLFYALLYCILSASHDQVDFINKKSSMRSLARSLEMTDIEDDAEL